MPRRPAPLLVAGLALLASAASAQDVQFRELEFEVEEVTAPHVALTPDGDLVFTLLGHLYRLSPEGGEATQLTRGPFFHKEPAVSPDGRTVAVVSDREPEHGDNVYLLSTEGGEARRVTAEAEAGRPAWSPDGGRVAFLAYERFRPLEPWSGATPARVRELDLESGLVEDVTGDFDSVVDVTYGPDGALYWVLQRVTGECGGCAESDLVRRGASGDLETLATLEGAVGQVRIRDEVIFYSVRRPWTRHWAVVARVREDARERVLDPGDVIRFGSAGEMAPRFAASGDGSRVYRGGWGSIWETMVWPPGSRRLPLRAKVVQTVMVGAEPPDWTPPEDGGAFEVRGVGTPMLSPDRREVAFSAAGTLWRRSLGDALAPPVRIADGPATYPTYAPDGRRVAYVRRGPPDGAELVLAEGWGGTPRLLARGRIHTPMWSPDGTSIVFTNARTLSLMDVAGGEIRTFEGWPWFTPAFSADGSTIFAYRTASPVSGRSVMRVPLDQPGEAAVLESIHRQVKDARVSADGRWLVFARNGDLWVADLELALADDGTVAEEEVRLLVEGGGLGFSFDPAGEAVVFARAGGIFRASLPDGEVETLTESFVLPGAAPPPLVVRDVRLLRADGAGFTEATDLYLAGGRIVGVGGAPPGPDFEGATEVEAGGRFAIPGLWDAHLHGGNLGYRAAWLAHGVTSLRDPGSEILEAVQEDEYDRLLGGGTFPRRFSSGEIFEGFEDRWYGQWHRITDPETGRRLVREWRALGARFIKEYATLSWPLQRAVAEEASKVGLPVMAHGGIPEEMVRGITLGYRSLEHNLSPGVHDDLLTLLAAAGTYWTPQFSQSIPVGSVLALKDPDGFDRGLRLLGRDPQPVNQGEPVDVLLGSWALTARELRRARELGVRILPGTDTYGGPGWVHVEFEAFQDAGFSPAEILRMATLDPALAEGVEAHLGTLETGKLADLLLVEADPLADVRNWRAPWMVLRGGRIVHRRGEG